MSVTIESEPSTNSANLDPTFPELSNFPEMEFSSESFTEMLLNYIFGPSEVKYNIVGNNRCSKLQAVIECLSFKVSVHVGFFWLVYYKETLVGRVIAGFCKAFEVQVQTRFFKVKFL